MSIQPTKLNVGDVFVVNGGFSTKFKVIRVLETGENNEYTIADLQAVWVPEDFREPDNDMYKKFVTKELFRNCRVEHSFILIDKDFKDIDTTNKEYPHRCPKCGSAAYVGMIETDCSQCGRF